MILNTRTVAHCLSLVSHETGVSREAICNTDLRGRNGPITRARAIACWLSRSITNKSYPAIGRELGMDHSSVIIACRRAKFLRANDPEFRRVSDRCAAAWEPPQAGLLASLV